MRKRKYRYNAVLFLTDCLEEHVKKVKQFLFDCYGSGSAKKLQLRLRNTPLQCLPADFLYAFIMCRYY